MKRVIIDTSSYEEMLLSLSLIELGILSNRNPYAVEGFVVIRKELRDVPHKKMLRLRSGEQVKMRLSLLSLYDYLTGGRSYPLEEKMAVTAEEYFAEYSSAGGMKNWEEMESDFEIVACAFHKQVDMSEIASGTSSFASAKRKPAISESQKLSVSDDAQKPELLTHAQNNTPLALARGCFDIVVSDDAKTMLSKVAMGTYAKVNEKLRLETPCFISVRELSKELRGVRLD